MNDQRARLFVALELPDQVRGTLAQWRTELPDFAGARGRSPLRPVAAEALHVTLCFLGWQDAEAIDAVAAACSPVGALGAAELVLGEALWLPPRRPRVLAVSLDDPSGRVGEVQSLLSQELERGGWYQPESRPFLAHVTVARVAKGGRVSREPLAAPGQLRFSASTVTLFRSRLSAAGARYEALARFELSG